MLIHGLAPGYGSKPLRELQPVKYRDRRPDNNIHCSLFNTIDCKMLAAQRLMCDNRKKKYKI